MRPILLLLAAMSIALLVIGGVAASQSTTTPETSGSDIQGSSPPQPVWYNAVLLGAAVTVAGAFVAARYAAWQDRKRRRNALLASYLGEVTVIQTELRRYSKRTLSSLKKDVGTLPDINKLALPVMPTNVFEETVGSLGEAGDAKLVELIAHLYAEIERANENARIFVEDATSALEDCSERKRHFGVYAPLLVDATLVSYVLKQLLHGSRVRAAELIETTPTEPEVEMDRKLMLDIKGLLLPDSTENQ
jgi:hypothetical protein